MTINIEELRRLAQAAKDGCKSAEWTHEFREGRFSEGRISSGDEMIIIICGGNFGCWRDADDDGESQFKALGDFVAAANPATISELLDRLEAAEKERDAAELMSLALRAKITEMKQQEPYCTAIGPGDWTYQISSPARPGMVLYALPGAKGEEK